jgi:hypothetical protein
MKDNSDQNSRSIKDGNSMTSGGQGPQGVDKAPGEETTEENVQFTKETQKGKKVDGDPSKESDQPVEQKI